MGGKDPQDHKTGSDDGRWRWESRQLLDVVEQQKQENFGVKIPRGLSGGNLEDKNVYSEGLASEGSSRDCVSAAVWCSSKESSCILTCPENLSEVKFQGNELIRLLEENWGQVVALLVLTALIQVCSEISMRSWWRKVSSICSSYRG